MSLLWKTATDQAEDYYHGTVHKFEPGERIAPASEHGGHQVFRNTSRPEYAYATPKEDEAWHYAQHAWNGMPLHHPDFGNPPRVYKVRPLGPVEKDPTEYTESGGRWRDPFDNDKRSAHGFEVLHEVPMPEDMGTPEEWR